MSTLDRNLIRQKIKRILQCLEELAPVARARFRDFEADARHFRLTERDIQLVVDTAVDINNHLLQAAGKAPPDTYYETFMMLNTIGILSRRQAQALAATAGLRNRIVHEYETVDLRIMHGALSGFISKYRVYCELISRRWGG
ncbi:MAG: DUF86 domain-containing protein [Planctomycetes bacterium]|nr:DUF86 domain-containing protein [Planctomycetota bacterium]